MGTQQSKVIITSKTYQNNKNDFKNIKNHTFSQNQNKNIHDVYTLQKCNYPHNLIKNQIKRKGKIIETSCSECNEIHQAYKKYNICSKCLKQPTPIHQNKKLKYQSNEGRQRIFKKDSFQEQNKKLYKQKQTGAIGPQVPVFFNGFSLPIEKYYKQKQNFGEFTTEYSRKQQIDLFRGNNKELQISIIQQTKHQQRAPVSPNKLLQKIDYKGSQQILKLHF